MQLISINFPLSISINLCFSPIDELFEYKYIFKKSFLKFLLFILINVGKIIFLESGIVFPFLSLITSKVYFSLDYLNSKIIS